MKNKFENKGKARLILTPLVLVLLFANLMCVVYVAACGSKVRALDMKNRELAGENQSIRDKIVAKTSLAKAGLKAGESGFTKPEEKIYVGSVSTVAIAQ